MKYTLVLLLLSAPAFTAEKAETAKPPAMADAMKARIWKAIANLREVELSAQQIKAAQELAQKEVQSAVEAAKVEGFQIDRDLNYIAMPKSEVKK